MLARIAKQDGTGRPRTLERADPYHDAMTTPRTDVFVHESAYVDEPCEIGAGTKVWHFAHVMKDVKIGKNCSLGQNVFVQSGVRLGDRVSIQNNVSVYTGVTVEDEVFLGPSCVFTNVVHPRAHVSRKNEFAKTRVGRGATIGANATIVCGHDVGPYAFVAAGSTVTKDVLPYQLVGGVPARPMGWVSQCGERLPGGLDVGRAPVRCERCGETYVRKDGKLERVARA